VPTIHVALLLYGLTGGGATRRPLPLAGGFAARGHEVDLFGADDSGPLRGKVPDGVRVVSLESAWTRAAARLPGSSRRNKLNASIPALARTLRDRRPDVLLSAANHAHLLALVTRRVMRSSVPLVLRVSNHLTRSHGAAAGVRARPLRLRIARRTYAWADAAIAVSRGIADDLRATTALDPERIFAVPNPTWSPAFETAAERAADHPWLQPGGPPVILAAGRLAPAKDFETLVRAFARVRAARPARLIVLGEGAQRGRIEALVRELGLSEDAALPGFVDDPLPWMARAGVFALSSAWEGSPGVLIEAMGCGCPVVATDCPSGPDEILAGGEFGPLVPVGDAEALARAIEARLDAPRDADRLRARAREFGADAAVDAYLAILTRFA